MELFSQPVTPNKTRLRVMLVENHSFRVLRRLCMVTLPVGYLAWSLIPCIKNLALQTKLKMLYVQNRLVQLNLVLIQGKFLTLETI